jgi:hypothetical protein
MVYDAGTCHRSSIPYEGTWGDFQEKGCGESSLLFGRTAFTQNHLLPLVQANLSFPGSYVSGGKVVTELYVPPESESPSSNGDKHVNVDGKHT